MMFNSVIVYQLPNSTMKNTYPLLLQTDSVVSHYLNSIPPDVQAGLFFALCVCFGFGLALRASVIGKRLNEKK